MKPYDGEILFSNAITIFGFLILLSGFLVLGYQGVLWLQQGYWTHIELREIGFLFGSGAISDPALSWQGIQKIVTLILDMPLFCALMLLGIGTAWLGVHMADEARHNQKIER